MNVQSVIQEKIEQSFDVAHMQLENESHMHSVPENSETHFKLLLVTDDFQQQRKVARHQSVYKVLQEELAAGVHALALHLYTEQEWQEKQIVPESPQCLGGSKADKSI